MHVALHMFLSALDNGECLLLHRQEFPPGFKEIWSIPLLSSQNHGTFGHDLVTLCDRIGSKAMPKNLKVIFWLLHFRRISENKMYMYHLCLNFA